MKKVGFIILGLFLLLGGLAMLMVERVNDSLDCPGLEVLCAAGLQKPMEEVARGFEEETGIPINLNFGGSGQLYSQLELVGGDVYFPADMSYIEQGQAEGILDESRRLSTLIAGFIVAQGNPKEIVTLEDLARDDVRVVMAEKSAAVGLLAHQVLKNAGVLNEIEEGAVAKMGTVSEVALQVELGSADVGIVWNVLEPQFESCDFISVAEFQAQPNHAGFARVKGSKWPEEVSVFFQYIINPNKGAKVFQKHRFDVIESATSDK